VLDQFIEDLPHVQPFAPRSKSALFFEPLLSRCPEFARRLALDARRDLNRAGSFLTLLSSRSCARSSPRTQFCISFREIVPEAPSTKKRALITSGSPKGIDWLTSRVFLRLHRFQGGQSLACRPDSPKGQARFSSVRRLPIYAHRLPISLTGRRSPSAKSFSSSSSSRKF